MTEVLVPLGLSIFYLLGLAAVSEAFERNERWATWTQHPVVFSLALGVFATSWSVYGSVGYMHSNGYLFAAIHLGAAIACLAIPIVWSRVAEMVRYHGLRSVADLLAYRYQSQVIGWITSLFLIAALLPYLSVQLRAIADAAAYLSRDDPPAWLGPVYAGLLSLFAAGLGVRYADPRRRRPGLIATLALESIVKIGVLTAVGVSAWSVVGGEGSVAAWIEAHPAVLERLYEPVHSAVWPSLLIASFGAMFLLPRQFHVAFVECPSPRTMRHVTWIVPAVLLIINLPVPLIYWAGSSLQTRAPPDLFLLAVAEHGGFATVAFLGGLSASSAMVLTTCIALSSMAVNHLVLPWFERRELSEFRLIGVRRIVSAGLVGAGFVAHTLIPRTSGLVDLGFISFIAVLQLLPGVIGGVLWTRANRGGLMLGFVGGVVTWGLAVWLPYSGWSMLDFLSSVSFSDPRTLAVWGSLTVNIALFGFGSLLLDSQESEGFGMSTAMPRSVEELQHDISAQVGPEMAEELVLGACSDLDVSSEERRPLLLLELAQRVEKRLSELMGPVTARAIVAPTEWLEGKRKPAMIAEHLYKLDRGSTPPSFDEEQPARRVRRYLRSVLEALPIGVCALDAGSRIAIWNPALAQLSKVTPERAVGAPVSALPDPWETILTLDEIEPGGTKEAIIGDSNSPRILLIRRSQLDPEAGTTTLLVEDLTERRALRAQAAHQDRLASVGQLAAGVAHEILNPLTGITMVAAGLSRAARAREDEDGASRLSLILSESKRIETIVRTLLEFSRAETSGAANLDLQPIEIRSVVEHAVSLAQLGHRRRGIRYELRDGLDTWVLADRSRLIQVLLNLLTNARDASSEGGRVMIDAREIGDDIVVEVADEGPGVPDVYTGRLFEPFFTTKNPGEGTGLGLSVAYRLVRDQGGELTWERRDQKQTVFCVRLRSGTESAYEELL